MSKAVSPCNVPATLRACADAAETAALLARLVGEAAMAMFSGVFLLNYTRTELLVTAMWSAKTAEGICVKPAGHSVPAPESVSMPTPTPTPVSALAPAALPVDADDPLCFALRSGQPYVTSVPKGSAVFPSALLLGQKSPALRLTALPLTTLQNRILGGVLLGFDHACPQLGLDAVLSLCDLGALLLDAHLRQRKGDLVLHSLHEDIRRLESSARSQLAAKAVFLGESSAALRVREHIAKAAITDIPVLLTGETGTGKEPAATALHCASPRNAGPFVTVNCAALPPQLLESELFGHQKGAFSGAHKEHEGLLRSARGGSVLLDEIGEMPMELQSKLLRVLQDHYVRPVGSIRAYPVDIRIISSTNRDLAAAAASNTFRADLYHRLAGLHIHIPPLRERIHDIPVLAEHFLGILRTTLRRPTLRLSPESLRLLCTGSYPGNARELRNRIQAAAVMADSATQYLTPADFAAAEPCFDKKDAPIASLAGQLRTLEQKLITRAMSQCDGNISEAAILLDLPRSTLVSKLKKLHPALRRNDTPKPRRRQTSFAGVSYGYHA